jgi:hypothetical protein
MTLPPIDCARCGACCGPVLVDLEEWQAIATFAWVEGVEPLERGIDCPFLRPDGCAVYPVRPRVCRLMGHSPRLQCARRRNHNVSPRDEQRFMEGYRPTLLLGELCGCNPARRSATLRDALQRCVTCCNIRARNEEAPGEIPRAIDETFTRVG